MTKTIRNGLRKGPKDNYSGGILGQTIQPPSPFSSIIQSPRISPPSPQKRAVKCLLSARDGEQREIYGKTFER